MVETQAIVVLDFGAQYSQLIARRIREQNVFSVVLPCTASLDEIKSYSPAGIVLSGGPSSVYDPDAPPADEQVLHLGLPVLGICYGLQFMVYKLGGKVRAADKREYGHAQVELLSNESAALQKPARTGGGVDVARRRGLGASGRLRVDRHNVECSGRHPVPAQRNGMRCNFIPKCITRRRAPRSCATSSSRSAGSNRTGRRRAFIDETVASVRQTVGKGRVICGLSGGVDSSVAAELVHRAIGDQLTCIFVNNGVLRKNEFISVQKNLREKLGLNIDAVDASERFLSKLAGVSEPEKKRKIIGNEFIAVFEEEAHRIEQLHGKVDWLVQGTLYPDVIESRSVRGPSQTIKSHHNVGGLPDIMKLKLIEPLKDLFKDEVRKIGRDLGMPEEILQRQPFPGPGLAVRILGEVTAERVALLQEADDIVVTEIKRAGLYNKVWQSFAVLLPVMSVGVMGDMRTYAYTCAIRAVHSEDGMTADWVPLPHEVLKTISSRIVNEVKGINRVVYDVTSQAAGND